MKRTFLSAAFVVAMLVTPAHGFKAFLIPKAERDAATAGPKPVAKKCLRQAFRDALQRHRLIAAAD